MSICRRCKSEIHGAMSSYGFYVTHRDPDVCCELLRAKAALEREKSKAARASLSRLRRMTRPRPTSLR